MSEPRWLTGARRYVGLREVPGTRHNPVIINWWSKIGQAFRDDETAWCAGFVGGVLEETGIRSTRSAAARSYARYGTRLTGPAVGAIVSFWRGSRNGWSGHVGFVVGRDAAGNLMVLGGNQGNAVSIVPFDMARVLAYTWPTGEPVPDLVGFSKLPLLRSDGKLSTNEA
jgi:uncharacterized protein (TIGR02594 family)